jgi:hypothetical protein
MKLKRTATLLAALGIVAPCVLAQTSTTPPANPSAPASASGVTAQPPVESRGELSSGGANATQSEAGMDLRPAPGPSERLKPVTRNDVTYLCGGVGEEEVQAMKQQAKDYDLMLTFAARDGAYLADVDVDISDARGNSVLQANCDSPMLLIDLPKAGTYRVHADAAGYTLNRSVKVAAGKKTGRHLATAVLVWPQQVAEAGGAASSTGTSGGASQGRSDSGAGSSSEAR